MIEPINNYVTLKIRYLKILSERKITMKEKAIQYVLWLMSDCSSLGFPELGKLVSIGEKYPRLFKAAANRKGN